MLQAYRQHAAERAALGIPPLPLDPKQVAELIELIKAPPAGEEAFLLDLLTPREACEFLIQKAKVRAQGGGDNISIVVVKFEALDAKVHPTGSTTKR